MRLLRGGDGQRAAVRNFDREFFGDDGLAGVRRRPADGASPASANSTNASHGQ